MTNDEWPSGLINHIIRSCKDPGRRARLRRVLRSNDPGTDLDALAVVAGFLPQGGDDAALHATVKAGVAAIMAGHVAVGPGTRWTSMGTLLRSGSLSDHRRERILHQLLRPGLSPAAQVRLVAQTLDHTDDTDRIDWDLLIRDLIALNRLSERSRIVRRWMRDYVRSPTPESDATEGEPVQ